MKTSIWWIRRDIRIQNNPALYEAVSQSTHVIPLFILDPSLLESKAEKRANFLFQALDSLKKELQNLGSNLLLLSGDPVEALQAAVSATGAEMIFAEEDYTPAAHQRDLKVAAVLPLWLVHGLTVFPPGMVVKSTGCPYTIFTPFKRAWKSLPLPGKPSLIRNITHLPPLPAISLQSTPIPGYHEEPSFPASEAEAIRRLDYFLSEPILHYSERRDRMDMDGTSSLSPYLSFGLISIQYIFERVSHLKENADPSTQQQIDVWVNEMIWREFYISIMHHFPEVLEGSFRRDLRNIRWRNIPNEFDTWKNGMTGYPVVDAGIRQLSQTGWMHNRARMITASFLVKDLLVNWQSGEEWFMQKLIDGDPALNNGGWQWTAGVGTDAVPYFRIFNPVLQGEKFDPTGNFVRKWVPELSMVPEEYIHKPWMIPSDLQRRLGFQIGKDYPKPVVDHKEMRKQTLAAFKTGEPRTKIEGCK